jgi:hypothetical protein
MGDTTADALRVQIDAIRQIDPVERLVQALAFSESVRAIALAGLRQRHPDRSEYELFQLLTGSEVATSR